ncbi:MAG: PilZ domain-containing protein [Steroidobacteraceae bacterium]
MQSGRLEGRMAMCIAARLEIPGEPAVERVVIKNISTHGACVVAKRSCRVDEPVVISDLLGTFRIDARVIYCSESLLDGECAIGLRFSETGPAYVG